MSVDDVQEFFEDDFEETEEDTRILRIDPKLEEATWVNKEKPWMVRRERYITDGRVIPDGKSGKRLKKKRADYILCYGRDFPIAIVEAKVKFKDATDGMDQAINYAEMIGVKFAYSTNGITIEEWDFTTDTQQTVDRFPTPEELWSRLHDKDKVPDDKKELMTKAFNRQSNSPEGGIIEPRYYQEQAVNNALSAILRGQKEILLTLATGTGKTYIAFQIAWRLWNSTEPKPKILFLTDRDALLKQAHDKDFAPFGNARKRIRGKKEEAYDMYFALYQALDVDKEEGEQEIELYKQYDSDFFDYVIIDECHRGVSEDGNWRSILDYFGDAVHIGMTATPKLLTTENQGTYEYFGEPVYKYSLKRGIADGFLAPYFVEEVNLDIDRTGYMPKEGERDIRTNKLLEQKLYKRKDFDQNIIIEERQKAVALDLLGYMKKNDQLDDKTILFCQNSTHASDMTKLIRNEAKRGHEYCKRIVSDEGQLGKIELEHFCDPKITNPVIAVTSKLMSTGIDAKTCKIVALDKNLKSMTEFKQIIGRGTRLSEKFGKFWFTIIDYRGVTALFDDPSWDGEPMRQKPKPVNKGTRPKGHKIQHPRTKGEEVFVEFRIVRVLNVESGNITVIKFEKYVKDNVITIAGDLVSDLQNIWVDLKNRRHFEEELEKVGITLNHVRQILEHYDCDVFDLLLHVAYNKQMRTRRERVTNAKKQKFYLEKPENTQKVIDVILNHYAEKGYKELELDKSRELLELEKFKEFGGLEGILEGIFENPIQFDEMINELIHALYEDYQA
jgi:type I restriction enzyme, R subunit